jgi:TM2 domain-containing membrane protein YozV/predicted transcriptional regulator
MAYILWVFSGFGALGFHRFYLGKIGTGLLWFVSGGLGMIGSLYDLVKMPDLVYQANLRKKYKDALLYGDGRLPLESQVPEKPKDSIEIIILRTAKRKNGAVTPSEVALEGNIPIDDAKQYLDKLVSSGHAQMRIRESGVIVYIFPEFIEDNSSRYVDV